MRSYPVFYLEGLNHQLRPGTKNLYLKWGGVKLNGQFIAWKDMTDFRIEYKVSDQQGSIAGAAAGAIIAGGVGAIIGGMRNSKNVEPHVKIAYSDQGKHRNLLFICKKAEKLQKTYIRRSHLKGEALASREDYKQQTPLVKRAAKKYFAIYPFVYKQLKNLTSRFKQRDK